MMRFSFWQKSNKVKTTYGSATHACASSRQSISCGRRRDAGEHETKNLVKAIQLLVVLVFLAGGASVSSVAAQTGTISWQRPVNLSNSPESSGRPAIVADNHGYVHVFWSEDVGGKSILNIPNALIRNGDTIFYTRWDGASWTQPIDILFVPGDPVAEYVAAIVDKENQIHLVWTGYSNFYYSTAPAWQAHLAHSWRTPVVVATGSARSQWESDIVVDASGNIHIAYATGGDDAGVYHVLSTDGGASWQTPTRLSAALDELETSFANVRIIADGAQRLHVIWQTNEAEGFGQGIYYTRSVDEGRAWSAPVRMAYKDPGEYGVTFPSIASVGESELHLIYVDGPWHIGRYHRISRDGGETWSEPNHVFTDFEGINGYPIFLVDGNGGLHLVITWRTRTQIGGTYYARWLGTTWSPMELAVPETDQWPGAHWTAATMRLGNEIHIVFNTNFSDKAGEIWHTRGSIPDVPPVTAAPIPVVETRASASPTAPATRVPVATSEWRSDDLAGSPLLTASENLSALVWMIPLLVLIMGAVAWALGRPR
jgi:hypothetical protein